MMRWAFWVTISLFWVAAAHAQRPEDLICQIDPERLRAHIEYLEANPVDGKPTYSRSAYRRDLIEAAADYIRRQFQGSLRLEVRFDDFSGMRNVVATLPGTDDDPQVYIIGAHYDSEASRETDWNPYVSSAPGANDNATGVAVLLEVARVLSQQEHRHTLEFVAFDAKELGLFGSRHHAALAADQSRPVAGMFNVDMVGFNGWFDRVEVVSDRASSWFANYLWLASDWYGLGLAVSRNIDPTLDDSDHRSFWDHGYRAVLLTEDGEPWLDKSHYVADPYYHTYFDRSQEVNVPLVQKVAQLLTGVVAELADQTGVAQPPRIELLPPVQNHRNPVTIRGRFESDLPLRILIQPGDMVASLDRAAGTFSAAVTLKGGPNQIKATAISPAGITTRSLAVEFLPVFRFLEAYVFPNPGRELVQFRCLGDRPIDTMRVHIHQPDGNLVRSIEGVADKADARVWRAWWNLKVGGLAAVDGLYPCVFEAEVSGETHRTSVLLAVER